MKPNTPMTLQNELSPTSTLDQNEAPETAKGETSLPPETILVVDDNRQIANFLSSQLLPQLGYHSLVAHSGKEALRVLEDKTVSLMVLDLELPDMQGLDILRRLAKQNRKIPAILVTGHGSEQVAVEAFRLGVQNYMTKPIDTEQLGASIKQALRETRLVRERAQLTTQLRRQLNWQTTLARIGRSVTSSLNLDDVLRRIVEAATHLTRAEEGFLALLENSSDQLYIRAVKNIDSEKSKTMRLPVNDSLVGVALRTKRPIRTTTETDEGPLIKVSTGFLVHSLLHVPIYAKGKPLGVLSVVNHSAQRPFKEIDEVLLIALADYAAVALENANLYMQAKMEISERKKVEEALRISKDRYKLAMRGANDGLWDWDLQKDEVYYSQRWKGMLGYADRDVSSSSDEWLKRIHPEDVEKLKLDLTAHFKGSTSHFENEHRMLHRDGTYRWMLSRGLAVFDDEEKRALRIAGSQTDITDRKYAEDKLLHDAFYDTMTGLPNRGLFLDHLTLAVERAKRKKDYQYAVLFMDLDRFKDVNDVHGHLTGDKLLVAVAHKLSKRLRSTDTFARFGGDEFVILLEDIHNIDDAKQVVEWIMQELSQTFTIDAHEINISASIGVVMGEKTYQTPDDVLRDADIALYNAKGKGKSRTEVFTHEMREQVMERLELEADLRHAVKNDELTLHYQIISSLKTNRVVGFEALVRWNHPQRGLLAPAEFIPFAEETGQIIAIDRWVMKKACTQLKEWKEIYANLDPIYVSVNLTTSHITQPDIIDFIQTTLQKTQLDPGCLRIEITESAILEYSEENALILQQIRDIGVEVQIDDFGIGYSSLSYLSNFPINGLKIDQSFINTINSDNSNLQIVQAIISLSNELGIGVVAEGIEDGAQLDKLKKLGCEFGQGYFLSNPMDRRKMKTKLDEVNTNTGILC